MLDGDWSQSPKTLTLRENRKNGATPIERGNFCDKNVKIECTQNLGMMVLILNVKSREKSIVMVYFDLGPSRDLI